MNRWQVVRLQGVLEEKEGFSLLHDFQALMIEIYDWASRMAAGLAAGFRVQSIGNTIEIEHERSSTAILLTLHLTMAMYPRSATLKFLAFLPRYSFKKITASWDGLSEQIPGVFMCKKPMVKVGTFGCCRNRTLCKFLKIFSQKERVKTSKSTEGRGFRGWCDVILGWA